jgi:uncharacterized membrane protein
MFGGVYDLLVRIGYHHPIHPTEVHMPIGLVVGALITALVAFLFHRERLVLTARHCAIIAFIWIFPTMLLGLMDWQHFYKGAWLFPIKVKIVVAPSLAVLLFLALFLGRRFGAASKAVIPVYFLCFFAVVVLGYFGGQLVYGTKTTAAPGASKTGEKIFAKYCGACHPQGGNSLDPSRPVVHSSKLVDFKTFLDWIRKPKSPMPAFPASSLTEERAKELYDYVSAVWKSPCP